MNLTQASAGSLPVMKKRSWFAMVAADFRKYRMLYLMFLPVLAYYIIFHYIPMYGATIAFKEFNPMKGVLGSPWIGFDHFTDFFQSVYFWRVIRNTLLINLYNLVFGFPAPIILALLLNEIRGNLFKRTIQTVTYMPHFISVMVICGMIIDFTATDGVINQVIVALGGDKKNLMSLPELFRPIFVGTSIWQELGWGSIIYLAAMTAIDPQQYEAATIDGAGRFRKLWNVTIPGIMPTIVILLILRMGSMMNVGFEKIILLYSPSTYETADVISSFVYRKGILNFSFSFSSAVGLFNSLINFTLLATANWISRKVNETSLW